MMSFGGEIKSFEYIEHANDNMHMAATNPNILGFWFGFVLFGSVEHWNTSVIYDTLVRVYDVLELTLVHVQPPSNQNGAVSSDFATVRISFKFHGRNGRKVE